MADEADVANQQVENLEASSVMAVRRAAANIPAGEPGDCAECGEFFTRTVGGYCCRCRDKQSRVRGRGY